MKKVSTAVHDPALFECPCQECYDELRIRAEKIINNKGTTRALNRLATLVKIALVISIIENLFMVALFALIWLGWI